MNKFMCHLNKAINAINAHNCTPGFISLVSIENDQCG